MKTKNKPAYYHTGTDSFDNPEIRRFRPSDYVPQEFSCGPFPTFKAAKQDFKKMVKSDIENSRYLLSNVRKLKKGAEK